VPRKYTALPAGQVMGRAWSGFGCSAPQRWDFGTRRVAPFSWGGLSVWVRERGRGRVRR
jgi:hypothetical protein